MSKGTPIFTRAHARAIAEAHEIEFILDDLEERELLYQEHPELLAAYEALLFRAEIS